MSRYQRHIFVCQNERPAGHPKGCCLEKGSADVRDALRSELKRHGVLGLVRVNNSGCLDACEHGVSVVVYPEGVWYGRVTNADAAEIVEKHILHGKIVQRLLMPDARYAPRQ